MTSRRDGWPLTAQALSDLSGAAGYPNNVLIDIFFEIAANSGVLDSAVASLADALGKFEKTGKTGQISD